MCRRCVFVPVSVKVEIIKKLNSNGMPIMEYLETMSPLDEQKLNSLMVLTKLSAFENQDDRHTSVSTVMNPGTREWEQCTFYVAQMEDYLSAVQLMNQ